MHALTEEDLSHVIRFERLRAAASALFLALVLFGATGIRNGSVLWISVITHQLDEIGNRRTANPADNSVNSSPAERLGKHFRAELAAPNTETPVFATAEITAERQTAGEPDEEGQPVIQTESATVTTTRFVPQTPESFPHDDVGNLTSDGRWTNVWDAENRLIEQTTTASAVATGARNLKLVNAYDHAGRRIQKAVSEWNGTTWSQKYTLNFLYADGTSSPRSPPTTAPSSAHTLGEPTCQAEEPPEASEA